MKTKKEKTTAIVILSVTPDGTKGGYNCVATVRTKDIPDGMNFLARANGTTRRKVEFDYTLHILDKLDLTDCTLALYCDDAGLSLLLDDYCDADAELSVFLSALAERKILIKNRDTRDLCGWLLRNTMGGKNVRN